MSCYIKWSNDAKPQTHNQCPCSQLTICFIKYNFGAKLFNCHSKYTANPRLSKPLCRANITHNDFKLSTQTIGETIPLTKTILIKNKKINNRIHLENSLVINHDGKTQELLPQNKHIAVAQIT